MEENSNVSKAVKKGRVNRPKILIVDDSEMNRFILSEILGEKYEILEAKNGTEAISIMKNRSRELSLILLDIIMPEVDGFEVLGVMNKNHWLEDMPVIMISSESAPAYVARAFDLGVSDFISRPFDSTIVKKRVQNTIILYAKQKKLQDIVADQIMEKQKSNNLMIEILSHIVEFRNGESGMHVLHIRIITEILMNHLLEKTDRYNVTASDINMIGMAAALHDIGKIAIPEEVLNKPGRLTDEEYAIMKRHSMIGANMLNDLPFQNEPLVKIAYEICRWHHERYDGGGYPDGLKGEEIPISAQIVSIADVYDALTSERVYKKAFSHEKAMDMIVNGECGTFNPLLLECLAETAEEIREAMQGEATIENTADEMRQIVQEVMHHEKLSAPARTLHLLEYERRKHQFYTSLTDEMLFEYTVAPAILTLSESASRHFGVDSVVMEPITSGLLPSFFESEDYKKLEELAKQMQPEDSLIQYECEMKVSGESRWYRLICQSMWTVDEEPQLEGIIGKVVPMQSEQDSKINVQELASTDGLTGFPNMPCIKRQIKECLNTMQEEAYAMVMIDMDRFRKANAKYGRLFGDHVLQYMAGLIKGCVTDKDIAGRIGGDVFILLLAYKDDIKERIEGIFNELNSEYSGFQISVSIGIATTEDGYTTYNDLYLRAQSAVYAAKHAGRNQYVFYNKEIDE